jgi:S-DNA-T family DNA segregation ATPase FtsK/SpoIIIE
MIHQKVFIRPQSKEDILGQILYSFGIKYEYIYLKEEKYFDIFNVKLALGTKVSKLESIMTDVGLALSAKATPRGYPVLETGLFKIEVQKHNIPSKSFEQLISSKNKNFYTPILLGTDYSGSNLCVDLNSLPNLLISGSSGSGKSMLLHTIILSLLCGDNSIHLIDPKMVEFSQYSDFQGVENIVHTIDDVNKLIKNLINTMEARFFLLREKGLRHAKEDKTMRPIIIVVDEWADLVFQSKTLEKDLSILAQKGRAAGISIILSTQRPSSKVVSGLIKANFIGRVCMKVSSATDSRIILDQAGGEKLREVGTGLFLDGKSNEPIFFKSPLISSIQDELINLGVKPKKKSFWNRIFG